MANISALADYADDSRHWTLNDDIIKQARDHLMSVYGRPVLGQTRSEDLKHLRAHKFLHNNTPVLKMLPPTEAAFIQHLKRGALATLRNKLALSPKPDLHRLTTLDGSSEKDH